MKINSKSFTNFSFTCSTQNTYNNPSTCIIIYQQIGNIVYDRLQVFVHAIRIWFLNKFFNLEENHTNKTYELHHSSFTSSSFDITKVM